MFEKLNEMYRDARKRREVRRYGITSEEIVERLQGETHVPAEWERFVNTTVRYLELATARQFKVHGWQPKNPEDTLKPGEGAYMQSIELAELVWERAFLEIWIRTGSDYESDEIRPKHAHLELALTETIRERIWGPPFRYVG